MGKLFWGLQIESGKAYAQTVSQSFAIRQAVLQTKKDGGADGLVKLFAKYENNEFLLCVLSAADVESRQFPLHVKFETGAQLTLRVEGNPNAAVHLTGYCIPAESSVGTPSSSAIAVPFEGSQRSILVSTKTEKGADELKAGNKRVSMDVTSSSSPTKKMAKGNKSVSFVDDDDLNFIKNGLPENDEDEDDDDDDDFDAEDDETTEDSEEDGLPLFTKQVSKQLSAKMKGQENEENEDDDDDDDDDNDDDDDDEGEEEEDDDGDDDEDDEEDIEMDDDDDDEDEEDEDEDIGVAMQSKPTSTPKSPRKQEGKKLNESMNGKKTQNEMKSPGTPKNQKKNEAKTPETPKQQKSPTEQKTPENKGQPPKTPSSAGHTPMKFVSKGGVMVQELKVGSGPVAKKGKMVTVYYQGRLKQNNRLFDSRESGPGFKFRLGQGEVIRGWDIGVEGMKVGGKRKLIIPSNLAYGKRGAPPDIPPNSTLVFDVELKHVS